MGYRLYVYNYECGWVRYKKEKLEQIKEIMGMLDPYEYGNYIIIDEKSDRDESIDSGFIAKPHLKRLTLDSKKKKK